MAAETIDIPEITEKIVLEGDHTRRNSTANFHFSKSGVKVLPRYLSDSISSCHDICKYGLKPILEKNATIPITKRITARPCEDQDKSEGANLEPKKKKSVISSRNLANSKNQSTEEHQISEKDTPLSAKKKMATSSQPTVSRGERADVYEKHASDLKAKTLQMKPSSFSTTERSSSRWHSDVSPSNEMKNPRFRGKENDVLPPSVSPFLKPSIKRELISKSGQNKDTKQVSHMKSRNSARKAEPKQPIEEKVPEKTFYVVETKPIVGLNQDAKERNGTHITPSCSSSSLSLEKKSLRSIKNGNGSASSSSLSMLSSSESMKSDESEPIFEGSGTKKVDRSSRSRRVVKVVSAGKSGSPKKLNFKRGKTPDVQANNTSPRQLRLSPRRVLGENQNGKGDSDTNRISLKEVVAIGDLKESKTKPADVVLRHHEVEGKKGGESLLNDVIEETASKLEQSRKSKVKALVGAFETVISLKDTKSSATII